RSVRPGRPRWCYNGSARVARWGMRRPAMPTYISLIRLTDQGIRDVKGAPDRQRQAVQRAEQEGGNLTIYVTMGEYDSVAILEAPDDQAAMRGLLALEAQGNIRTTTLKAFSREEFEQVVRSLP